jgi:hypothetical protein
VTGGPVVTVHCCWCPHTERGLDPYAVHDEMEVHYRTVHRWRIAALTRRA